MVGAVGGMHLSQNHPFPTVYPCGGRGGILHDSSFSMFSFPRPTSFVFIWSRIKKRTETREKDITLKL